ncbi:MAG: hypothetical protein WBM07_13220 [Chitinivibrionales bacterium]
MKNRVMVFLAALIVYAFYASAQPASDIWYSPPLFNADDPKGKRMSSIIDVELSKLAMNNRLGKLKKLPYAVDTALQRMFQQRSLQRENDGFFNYASVQHVLQSFNLPLSRVLLIYDITADQETATKKSDLDKYPTPNPGGQIATSVISNINFDNIDSIWCRVSLFDFNNPLLLTNHILDANDQTCKGSSIDCVTETIQNFGRIGNSPKNDNFFVGSPHDQHWGKIVGGSLLLAGGVTILALALSSQNASPAAVVLGGAMACGGCTILTIGIIKQADYSKWKNKQ